MRYLNAVEFEQLWSNYEKDMYRFCLHLTCSKDVADDLYQDTALVAFEKADQIEATNNPRAYLFSIAVKLSHNFFRKEKRRNDIKPIVYGDDDYEMISSDFDLEKSVEDKERNAMIKRAINRLEEKFRIPFVLYYFDERGIEFIATVMKLPVGTIKSRLHKARMLLKMELEKEGLVYE